MITTSVAKFILIAVFLNGGNSYTMFANLGEFTSMSNCQAAASASLKAHKILGLSGSGTPQFICAEK